jgi:hypothetical protein
VAKVTAAAATIASAVIAEVRFIIEMNPFLWEAGGNDERAAAAPRLPASD